MLQQNENVHSFIQQQHHK